MRIIEKTGTSLVLDSEETAQRLAEDTKQLLEYVKQVCSLQISVFKDKRNVSIIF